MSPTSPDRPLSSVAAVVVAYNGSQFVSLCLESLGQSSVALNVIVVDNASTDDTRKVVGSFSDVMLIENNLNVGFGRGCNTGMAHALNAGADYILLLNQDAQVQPTTVGMLLEHMQQNPRVGIACPLQFNAGGDAVDDIFLQYYLAPFASRLISDSIQGKLQRSYVVKHTPAAAWLISAKFLREVGGFDPLFFMYSEDDDICRRAAFHGYDVSVVPAARFNHMRAFYVKKKPESLFQQIKRKTSRIRSTLVASAKNPQGRPVKNLYHSITKQLCDSMGKLIAHMDWIPFVASLIASFGTVSELPRIFRHRRISIAKGPHWLNSPTSLERKQ